MTSWLTTILIFLPVAGALLVWLVPMPAKSVGSIAALVSLVEIAVWIAAVEHFDFGSGELQLAQQRPWFRDLGVSYHVGQFGYSLWLVGLTVVCGAAACLYAWWVGRERPRAYFGLLLFLTGAVVGVFAIEVVSFVLADAYPTVWPVILGVLLLVVILFRPSGLIGLVLDQRARAGAFRVAVRRPRHVPGKAADGAA